MTVRILGIILSVLTISIVSCASFVKIYSFKDISNIPEQLKKEIELFENTEYVYYQTHYIRTYFHFFDDLKGSLNYSEQEAYTFINQLLTASNDRFQKNDKMNLPLGNDTPVLDSKIRIRHSQYNGRPGMFFHRSDSPEYFIKNGKAKNLYSRQVLSEFGVGGDSIVNVFVLPFDPVQLSNGEQKLEKTAIALGNCIKLPGPKQLNEPGWNYSAIFNHEMGHILGLRHTWKYNDDCADTPLHSNCWNYDGPPPCDTEYSNNLMDYNTHQSAITPCQINLMHSAIGRSGSKANRVAIDDWCNRDNLHEIVIKDRERWDSPMMLRGNLIIEGSGMLSISSMVHLPRDAVVKIKKGGTLILDGATFYNACNESWGGLHVHPKGTVYTSGKKSYMRDVY